MPTHYMYPISELPKENWNELSENFYGLMGGGITTMFDQFPPVFDQILAIAEVDFSEIMPIYHSVALEHLEHMQIIGEENNFSWQDIFKVKVKFNQLYNNLLLMPDFSSRIKFVENEYGPERSYFTDLEKGKIVIDFNKGGDKYERYAEKCALYEEYYPDLDDDFIWSSLMPNQLNIPEGE